MTRNLLTPVASTKCLVAAASLLKIAPVILTPHASYTGSKYSRMTGSRLSADFGVYWGDCATTMCESVQLETVSSYTQQRHGRLDVGRRRGLFDSAMCRMPGIRGPQHEKSVKGKLPQKDAFPRLHPALPWIGGLFIIGVAERE